MTSIHQNPPKSNPSYHNYLKTEHWKKLRSTKNGQRCGICAATENLDLHHLNYRNLFDAQLSDLRTLCRTCHFTAHRLYKEGKLVFKSTNHHSRFALIKAAVKKERGFGNKNMFVFHPTTET